MASPTRQSVSGTTFASATSHPVACPATVNLGDLLAMIFGLDGTTTGAPTLTTPSGWSILCVRTQAQVAANFVAGIVYAKDAAGTEGGTTVDVVTSAAVVAAAQVYRVTGWGGTLGTDVVAGTPSSTNTGQTIDPPSVSWSWGSLDELIIAATVSDANGWTGPTAPTNYTNLTVENLGATPVTIASATRALTATASPEDPGVFTWTGASNHPMVAFTIAIKPASGVAHSAAAVLAGVGTVAAKGTRGAKGASVLAGVGTMNAVPKYGARAKATLAGVGTLSAVGKWGGHGQAVLAGVGTVSAVGLSYRKGQAVLAGVGALTAVGKRGARGQTVLAGVGALSAVAKYGAGGKAVLAGVATVAAAGRLGAGGRVLLAGVGTVSAVGRRGHRAQALLAGVGTLVAVGTRVVIVIVPTRQRPRVYIHDGATLARIGQLTAVADINRSFTLREHARAASFTVGMDDPALGLTSVFDANVVVIESSEYPYPYAGRIVEREGNATSVAISADGYEAILGERKLPSDFTTPADAGTAFRAILAAINGVNATGISVGRVEDGLGAPMSLPDEIGTNALDKLAEVAGMEWWVSAHLDGPTLVLQANLAKYRGADLYSAVVLDGPGGNYELESWRENGRANAYAQTVIGGQATAADVFTARDRATAIRDSQQVRSGALIVEAQRVLRFDYLIAGETSFIAPTQRRELVTVREELKAIGYVGPLAEQLLTRRRSPGQIVLGRAYPDSANSWQYLRPGNVVHLKHADAFITGYDGPAVIVGVQPMEHLRWVDVALEVA